MTSVSRIRSRWFLQCVLVTCTVWIAVPASYAADKSNAPPTPPTEIQTEFVEDAQLSKAEVDQLVALARQCGINDVAKVETFHIMPSKRRGISVSSKERVDGRSISYDRIQVQCIGWQNSDPEPDAKRVGPFWSRDTKRTALLREFEIGKERIRIGIGKGVDLAIVDVAIPLIASKEVRFEKGATFVETTFSDLRISEANHIIKNESGDGYELWFGKYGGEILSFKVENGKVIVTGIDDYVV